MFRRTLMPSIFADRLRIGHIVKYEGKFWRVAKALRTQKGKNNASIHLKLDELIVGLGARSKEISMGANQDVQEASYSRLRMVFSGFDDDDNACFVYPQDSVKSGQEINIPAVHLTPTQQNFLSVRMPCDLLQITDEGEDGGKEIYPEVKIPDSGIYTVERITAKAMFKFATLKECDGQVTVTDVIQPGDKIKVIIRVDGGSFGGRAD